MADNPTNIIQQVAIKQQQAAGEEKIHVVVRNRQKILFDDNVKSVTSKNDTGIFDILPEHANFISLITSPLTIRTADGKQQEIAFKNGLVKVKDNAVYCYIDLIAKETAR